MKRKTCCVPPLPTLYGWGGTRDARIDGDRARWVFVTLLAGFVAGCSNASKRIDESIDRIAWAEQGSPVWEETIAWIIHKQGLSRAVINPNYESFVLVKIACN